MFDVDVDVDVLLDCCLKMFDVDVDVSLDCCLKAPLDVVGVLLVLLFERKMLTLMCCCWYKC